MQQLRGQPHREVEAQEPPIRAIILHETEPVSPLTLPELRLHLVTPAQAWWRATPEDLTPLGVVDPYWAFCWPGGVALARYVLDHPELVRGRCIYDLGSGSGVTALAAVQAGAARVVANDIDPWALSSCRLNAQLNQLTLETNGQDLIGSPLPDCDVLLVGDTSYSKELVAKLWPWLQNLAANGTHVLLADPERGFLPADRPVRARLKAPAEIDATGEHWVQVDIVEL